jgi:hypothetical protein
MNVQSWIVLAAVVIVFVAVFRYYWKKQRRSGGCSCGCCDSCGAGCASDSRR